MLRTKSFLNCIISTSMHSHNKKIKLMMAVLQTEQQNFCLIEFFLLLLDRWTKRSQQYDYMPTAISLAWVVSGCLPLPSISSFSYSTQNKWLLLLSLILDSKLPAVFVRDLRQGKGGARRPDRRTRSNMQNRFPDALSRFTCWDQVGWEPHPSSMLEALLITLV